MEKFFILIVVICYLTVKVNSNCWWTGCQPFSWAQRGCDVYNMDEQKQADCDEGTKFYCCAKAKKEKKEKKSSSGGSTARECWWTGCQPSSWAQRGCGVYNMDEIASEECEDGDKYQCCSKIKSSSSTSRSSSSSSKRASTSSALQSEPKKRECWWTGCQPTSWAKRGCGVYNMVEIGNEECSDGDKYHCCEKIKTEESEEKTSNSGGQCWWTGCQPTSWAQRGCDVYDMDEVDNEECSDGNKFRCCSRSKKSATSKRSNSAQNTEKKVSEKCWWTGCMPNFLKIRGCEAFGLTEKERLVCNEGDQFHCCEKTEIGSTTSQTENKEEQCWWTGCQSFSWAQRGCEVYGMREMDSEECEGGSKYNCCGHYKDPKKKSSSKNEIIRTTTTAKPKSGKSECWWTGCQPYSWAQRGCGVYGMDEKESEECDGGNKFHCCTKGSVSISSRSDESPPKRKITRSNKEVTCKWTGCQPNSWSDKGCLDEDDVEIENEECDGGMKYHCCDGEPPTTPRPKRTQTTQRSFGSRALSPTNPTKLKLNAHNLKQECWWTGCQPSSWPQRGCRIYSMIEMNNERCGEGVRYQCCKKQMPMKTERLTTGCWWTGCQPFDWAQRGCEVYEMNQIKVENCPHGEKYYCCGKATSPEELQRGLRLKSVP
ncbi:uncharacterized protein B4U80_06603 [Leptotrombidium deliense]|uniref:Uncharacterized protein n=1 Tax=Leptotrombidium deliense TaxID=299467 RepID=A0A443SLT2_9ACAR|nr:uncharacterized protein B4U80_06603 [Leptotrombidium deliense]